MNFLGFFFSTGGKTVCDFGRLLNNSWHVTGHCMCYAKHLDGLVEGIVPE